MKDRDQTLGETGKDQKQRNEPEHGQLGGRSTDEQTTADQELPRMPGQKPAGGLKQDPSATRE